ncbi:uncharacterized protein K452DRAFT_361015 [Aplosporella prunicola CBS 121167]|uniref:Ribosome biogenesis protein Alb1 n=1 Tax=Aplosporella prunicola CBS 121167 TaxID=1176127 RepID=A0A6A6B589_9PEZI|nr:uncharacterized protein K452DRAFT_361015 [Aplosporella prunicola CBS 121167]KAF2138788.1 hypothetical protein K452DRAFT_361015 [Aplosporella prunicola CBS 121167]
MAKAKNQQVSKHSRAARRAELPVDKSLLPDASSLPKHKPKAEVSDSVLAAQNAGVSKKQKQKRMTHQQRMRQEKAMDRAEAVMDQLEKKVSESKRRGRKVQDRRKEWEALNGDAKKKVLAADEDNDEDDVDMDVATGSKQATLASINAATVAASGRKPAPKAPVAAEPEAETMEDEVY